VHYGKKELMTNFSERGNLWVIVGVNSQHRGMISLAWLLCQHAPHFQGLTMILEQ
jgi:hypothetical protein